MSLSSKPSTLRQSVHAVSVRSVGCYHSHVLADDDGCQLCDFLNLRLHRLRRLAVSASTLSAWFRFASTMRA